VKIKLASIFVDDQERAARFYTDVLGFVIKHDIPVGAYRWLTVVSADQPEGMELLLEPDAHEAAKTFQQAIFADSIPATALFTEDLQSEYERLKGLGVTFASEPTKHGDVAIALFDDTVGNLIQLTQQ
jgi:catechol 2,3-dioxygenase-like lactoylglutathione lyase family enzyme